MSRDMLDAGICKSRSFATRACLGYALLRDSEGVEESLTASADVTIVTPMSPLSPMSPTLLEFSRMSRLL